MNQTRFFFDGSECSDCYEVPDLANRPNGKRAGSPSSATSEHVAAAHPTTQANPTAWPKIRFWQHTLNNADAFGIQLHTDLWVCACMCSGCDGSGGGGGVWVCVLLRLLLSFLTRTGVLDLWTADV